MATQQRLLVPTGELAVYLFLLILQTIPDVVVSTQSVKPRFKYTPSNAYAYVQAFSEARAAVDSLGEKGINAAVQVLGAGVLGAK